LVVRACRESIEENLSHISGMAKTRPRRIKILPLSHCQTDTGIPSRPVPALKRSVKSAIDNPSEAAMM
jgi:hypothetical protein